MSLVSIPQYFSKLQSALYLFLIVPLLVFVALFFTSEGRIQAVRPEYYALVPLALADWVLATVIFNKRLKSVRNVQGLGSKLEKYYAMTLVRFGLLSSGSLLLACGTYLTNWDIFAWVYLAGLVWTGFLWPTTGRVCRHLNLRGDEREMVYFKKDAL